MTSKMECFDQASFCFENRAQDAPKARQDAARYHKTPLQDPPKTPRRRPKMRPGRLQEAPRRPKTHPRRRKTPARRPKTPPRCDFGGFREPNWNQVGHPRAAQTHVLLSFCSVGRVPKPTNTLLTDSPNNGLVPPSANLDSPIGLGGFAKRKELFCFCMHLMGIHSVPW